MQTATVQDRPIFKKCPEFYNTIIFCLKYNLFRQIPLYIRIERTYNNHQ